MTTDSVVLTAKPGKYLAVRHGREEYGIDVQKVFIVTRLKGPTRDPRAPGLVQAVINLRGRSVPVVDLRHFLGTDTEPSSHGAHVVVVKVAQGDKCLAVGAIVDEASEVLEIAAEQIRPASGSGASMDPGCSLGIGNMGNRRLTLLNVDRLLCHTEIVLASQCVFS